MTKAGRKGGIKTRDIAEIALFSALIVICTWIMVPGVIPFTMQTFAIFTACGVLGGFRGLISVSVYIFIGLLGLPVFTGFSAGPGVLFGATGGYIIGFIGTALVMWLLERLLPASRLMTVISMVCGLIVCYAFGTAWYMLVYTSGGGGVTLASALGACVLPFVLPDAAKIALASLVVFRLKKIKR